MRSSGHRRLFCSRSFAAVWAGPAISFVGDRFHWLAVPIMVEGLTGSALMVGLSTISNALPMLLLGPIAGVLVDRWDRKRTMIVVDLSVFRHSPSGCLYKRGLWIIIH